jgi:hypothetical protein
MIVFELIIAGYLAHSISSLSDETDQRFHGDPAPQVSFMEDYQSRSECQFKSRRGAEIGSDRRGY